MGGGTCTQPRLQPAWAGVPLGSAGCGNQQQLLLRAAGSRHHGVLPSCESPWPWEAMLTLISPWVGSDRSHRLLRASNGGQGLPAASVPPKRIRDWGGGGEQPSCSQRERMGLLPLRPSGCILPRCTGGELPASRRAAGAAGSIPGLVAHPRAAMAERPGSQAGAGRPPSCFALPQRPRKEVVAFLGEEKGSRAASTGQPAAPAARSGLPFVSTAQSPRTCPACAAQQGKEGGGSSATLPRSWGLSHGGLWPSPLPVLTPCLREVGTPQLGLLWGLGGCRYRLAACRFCFCCVLIFFFFSPSFGSKFEVYSLAGGPAAAGCWKGSPPGVPQGLVPAEPELPAICSLLLGYQLPPASPSVRKRTVRAALHLPWGSNVPPGPGWLLGYPHQCWGVRTGVPGLAGRSMGG